MKVKLEKNGIEKEIKVGYFWTTLIFGFFVPLIRGDLKWFIIEIIFFIIIGPFSFIVFSFMYNKMYIKDFIEQGWSPVDVNDKEVLKNKKIIKRN